MNHKRSDSKITEKSDRMEDTGLNSFNNSEPVDYDFSSTSRPEVDLLNSFGIPVIIINLNKEIVFYNNICAQLLGYRKKDMIAKPFAFLFAEKQNEELLWDIVIHDLRKGTSSTSEWELIKKDGEIIFGELIISKYKDQFFIITINDITERRNIERLKDEQTKEINIQYQKIRQVNEDLRISKHSKEKEVDLYEILIHHLPEINIFLIDQERRYVYSFVSQALYQKGYAKENIIGKHIKDVLSKEELIFHEKNLDIVFTGKPVHYRKELFNRIFNVDIMPVYQQKKVKYAYVLLNDISRLTEFENREHEINDALRTSRIKQQFLAKVSHEIRSPLSGIIGMIDFFEDTGLTSEQKKHMQVLRSSSELLYNLVNDLLDFTKLESGKMKLIPVVFDIRKEIQKTKDLFNIMANRLGIRYSLEIDQLVPALVEADRKRISQILVNLLSNAFKYTDKGEVKISVRANITNTEKCCIYIAVKDTGIGIRKEKLKTLFNAYEQEFTEKNIAQTGTGLGLLISKELANLMKGEICVKSELGKGSEFVFNFSARISQSTRTAEQTNIRKKQNQKFKAQVLLVEDKKVNQHVMKLMFEQLGCNVEIAGNGFEAIQKFKNSDYDLILMDIIMPEMDGITATKKIKLLNKKKTPPIIGLSAVTDKEEIESFLNAGLDDYIYKPVKIEIVSKKLTKWLT